MKVNFKSIGFICAVLITVVVGFIFLSVQGVAAQVPELRVLSSDGMQPALEDLTPQIEHAIERKLKSEYDSSKNLVDKIKTGEPFDVALLTTSTIDDMINQGKIAADSRVQLAQCGLGVGVRSGAPKPDISTPEAMKRALLNAKFVTFNSTGATAAVINKMFERLGIAEDMKPKIVSDPVSGGAQTKVAEGKADIVLILIPEVTRVPGVDYIGPLPGDLQGYIPFEGGVATNSHDQEKAKALLHFLSTPAGAAAMKAKGMQPH